MGKKTPSIQAKVETRTIHGTPRRVSAVTGVKKSADPEAVAKRTVAGLARRIGIRPDLSEVRLDETRESMLGTHVLFRQYHDGLPVSGGWIRVDVNPAGEVFHVLNDLIPTAELAKASALQKARQKKSPGKYTAKEAFDVAKKALAAKFRPSLEVVSKENVAFPVKGVPHAAIKLVVMSDKPRGEWKVYVDVVTGKVLGKFPLLKDATGKGRVFDPNPVVALDDSSLRDKSKIPDAAYRDVDLPGLDGKGFLDGSFVSTSTTPGRVKRPDLVFQFKRGKKAFTETMVYFHIDRVQRYLQDLGFKHVLDRPIKVDVVGQTDDNSHYSPVTKSLFFGTGGVNDSEDAEIILHEYGHAIQDAQVPGFGKSDECGAMGEGFGDYLSASFFAEHKPERLRPCVGTWDATSYSTDDPPCLRRLDSKKKYPKDLDGEVHDDGEIWSACLWEIRTALGARAADKLVIASHPLLSPDATFADGANALITTDSQLNAGKNKALIKSVFVKRGILKK
jgi:Zn-dependent metalloprotease